jgi:hypothetical protein
VLVVCVFRLTSAASTSASFQIKQERRYLRALSQSIQLPTPRLLVPTCGETDSALLSLKNFVHDVLKRSRAPGSVLETAQCYLEAIRTKVPEILRDEKGGTRAYFP